MGVVHCKYLFYLLGNDQLYSYLRKVFKKSELDTLNLFKKTSKDYFKEFYKEVIKYIDGLFSSKFMEEMSSQMEGQYGASQDRLIAKLFF